MSGTETERKVNMEIIEREIDEIKNADDMKGSYIHSGIAIGRVLTDLERGLITDAECDEWFDKINTALKEKEVTELQKDIWIQRNGLRKKLNYITVLELQLERLAKLSCQCERHDEAATELTNLTQVMIDVAQFLSKYD